MDELSKIRLQKIIDNGPGLASEDDIAFLKARRSYVASDRLLRKFGIKRDQAVEPLVEELDQDRRVNLDTQEPVVDAGEKVEVPATVANANPDDEYSGGNMDPDTNVTG